MRILSFILGLAMLGCAPARGNVGEAPNARGELRVWTARAIATVLALLDAESIAYLRVGSGLYLDSLLPRLGLADAVRPKARRPEGDSVAILVAQGEVELGVVVLTQILTTAGVELAGPLPPEIQSYLTFTGAVSSQTSAPGGARQLIEFLRGAEATRVIGSQGMQQP